MQNPNPVVVLDQVCRKCNLHPEYQLVLVEGEHHKLLFHYVVKVTSLQATGIGSSKRKARNAAAELLLDAMLENHEKIGIPRDAAILELIRAWKENGSFQNADELIENHVGTLQELCASRRWPVPQYDFVKEGHESHIRSFTISCKLGKEEEFGTGPSKKIAKHKAAERLYKRLIEVLPSGELDITNGKAKTELSPSYVNSRYESLKDAEIPVLTADVGALVSQFHRNLNKSNGKKLRELQSQSLNNPDFNYVEFLFQIATEQNFEVTYLDIDEKSYRGNHQCLVQLSTLPVAVCYGDGLTSQEAQISAARNALEYLKVFTNS